MQIISWHALIWTIYIKHRWFLLRSLKWHSRSTAGKYFCYIRSTHVVGCKWGASFFWCITRNVDCRRCTLVVEMQRVDCVRFFACIRIQYTCIYMHIHSYRCVYMDTCIHTHHTPDPPRNPPKRYGCTKAIQSSGSTYILHTCRILQVLHAKYTHITHITCSTRIHYMHCMHYMRSIALHCIALRWVPWVALHCVVLQYINTHDWSCRFHDYLTVCFSTSDGQSVDVCCVYSLVIYV